MASAVSRPVTIVTNQIVFLKMIVRYALALFIPLLCGCLRDSLSQCLEAESRGEYRFNSNNACGCNRALCQAGTLCVQGRCCDPASEDCGCQQTCTTGEVCVEGTCCDPGSASEPSQCGCGRACKYWEECVSDGAAYSCQCRPDRASDPSDCGCERPAVQQCAPTSERCGKETAAGPFMCLCDVSKAESLSRPENCGCRMRCPFDERTKEFSAICKSGVCTCRSENESLCAMLDEQGQPLRDSGGRVIYECKRTEECRCNKDNPPDFALHDSSNCGCSGPCQPGEQCLPCTANDLDPSCRGKDPKKAAKCVCDPLAHANDNNACGCRGACQVNIGEVCQGGVCVCHPANLNNSIMCGCNPDPNKRICDTTLPTTGGKGESCQGGACTCDPKLHSVDDANCGCQGACPGSPGAGLAYHCQAGTCLVSPAK